MYLMIHTQKRKIIQQISTSEDLHGTFFIIIYNMQKTLVIVLSETRAHTLTFSNF
jgi:hypothetical protein